MTFLKELKQLWLFDIFIIALFLFNSFHVGPFTIRVYATILMAISLIVGYLKNNNRRNLIPIKRTEVEIYIAFLIVMSMCLLINGEFSEYAFLEKILAYHLPCIVAFFAISSKVDTYETIRHTIIVLFVILILDEIITVLQASGNSAAWGVGITLSPLDNINERADSHDGFLGYSVIPGLFGGVVKNAFYLASLSPLSLAFLGNNDHKISVIFVIGSLALSLYAIYVTQQRAAFYIFAISLMLFIFISIVKKPFFIFAFFFVALLTFPYIDSYFQTINLGRLTDTYDTGRNEIYQRAFEFIPDHIFIGGPESFLRIAGLPAHNLFIDGIISSGIIGLVLLIIFTLKTLFKAFQSFYYFLMGKCSIITFALSLAFLSCTLYGFTHNTSVLTGEPILFILWALLLKSIGIEKRSYDAIQKRFGVLS